MTDITEHPTREGLALRAARGRGIGTPTITRTAEILGPQVAPLLERLARSLAADEHADFIRLLDGFNELDRRRRRLLIAVLQDLTVARRFESGM